MQSYGANYDKLTARNSNALTDNCFHINYTLLIYVAAGNGSQWQIKISFKKKLE
jgi:hypothetical protein